MKKFMVLGMIFLMFAPVFAQDEAGAGDSPLSFGGGVGTVMIGNQTYMRLRFNPELTIGKLGIGLDIDLLMTEDGGIREEDWDDWKDYINKLYYIRWSQRGDTFFAKLGAFSSYQLGKGLIFSDYTNTLSYPQERQLGLMLGGRLPVLDMQLEAFTSNITNPSILAGRVSIAPLYQSGIPLLEKLRLGTTIGYDTDQYEGITDDEEELIMNTVDTDDDGTPDVNDFDPDGDGLFTIEHLLELGFTQNQIDQLIQIGGFVDSVENLNDPLEDLNANDQLVWGVDYELPLVATKMLALSHYAELSQIDGHGYGFIFPGFYSKFAIFHLNLEYRQYEADYLAGYFDHFYDQDRAFLQFDQATGEYNIFVKEDLLEGTVATRGWYGRLRADLFNFIYAEAGYTDMYADNEDDGIKSLTGTLGVNTKIIPKLKNMEFKYYQMDVRKITHIIAPRVVIRGTLRYELAPGTNLLWEYQERYNDVNNDGEIKGDQETERNVSMGVEFKF
jgi:hypothetical protein